MAACQRAVQHASLIESKMTPQVVCQIILLIGVMLSAAGGFGSFYFGKLEDRQGRKGASEAQLELKAQIAKLQNNFDSKTDQIFQAMNVRPDIWTAVEMNNVPPGVTDYLLLIFKSDRGRISGKVRVRGSENVASFSTTVNDTMPVAVANLWLPKEKQYKSPTIIEFAITEKTVADAKLSIFTQGWIDSRGREPH
jgi:hypothetical protein